MTDYVDESVRGAASGNDANQAAVRGALGLAGGERAWDIWMAKGVLRFECYHNLWIDERSRSKTASAGRGLHASGNDGSIVAACPHSRHKVGHSGAL